MVTKETPQSQSESLAGEIEARLSALEPDVEVLLVEVLGLGRNARVRIFLDRSEGVDHDLCARVTDHLRDLLRDYSIEVSSPGPDRPLTKPEHFSRFVGRRARVGTTTKIDGRTELKGELVDADDRGITLAGDWGVVNLTYQQIQRSNLIPEPIQVPRNPRRHAR